jgi:protein-disulfide isomerase
MKNPWVVIGLLIVILVGGSVLYSNNVASKNNEGITFKSHISGSDSAIITLTEYSDFQCPACASFQSVLSEVKNQFGDSVKIEFKNFPLTLIHPLAESAARAAEAAGQQDAFFAYHDLLYTNQIDWSNSRNPDVFFIQYANELGLDVDQFKRQMNSSIIKDKIKNDMKEGRDLGLTATPTFFLNGEKMTISTYEDFVNQIAKAIDPDVTFGVQ